MKCLPPSASPGRYQASNAVELVSYPHGHRLGLPKGKMNGWIWNRKLGRQSTHWRITIRKSRYRQIIAQEQHKYTPRALSTRGGTRKTGKMSKSEDDGARGGMGHLRQKRDSFSPWDYVFQCSAPVPLRAIRREVEEGKGNVFWGSAVFPSSHPRRLSDDHGGFRQWGAGHSSSLGQVVTSSSCTSQLASVLHTQPCRAMHPAQHSRPSSCIERSWRVTSQLLVPQSGATTVPVVEVNSWSSFRLPVSPRSGLVPNSTAGSSLVVVITRRHENISTSLGVYNSALI